MSDTYQRVYARIWDEPWTEPDRYLALYILTCRHRRFEGIYKLPVAYAADDLGWTRTKILAGLRRLQAAGFVDYDADTSVIWITSALKHQQPNRNQAKSSARQVLALPPSRLTEAFAKASRTLSPILAEALGEASANGSQSLKASKLQS